MPIRHIELDGYKCWSEQARLSMAPLTLVLGPNSVGKSALAQGLLAVAQSFSGVLPRRLVTRGRFVDLGSPRNVRAAAADGDLIGLGLGRYDGVGVTLVFDAESDGELQGMWMWMGEEERWWWSASFDDSSSELRFVPDAVGYPTLGIEGKQARRLLDLLGRDPRKRLEEGEPAHLWARVSVSLSRLVVDFESDEPLDGRTQGLLHSQLRGADDAENRQTISGALQRLLKSRIAMIGDEVDRLFPIGPGRVYGLRSDRVDDAQDDRWVGLAGERMPQVLHDHPECIDRVDRWLAKLGIDYRLSFVEAGQTALTVEPLLESTTEPVHRVGLPDVGFGIGQILPLLVQMAVLEEGMITVEQPEIHLHPGMQASLAEVVADWIGLSSEAEGPSQRQILIETHSEHLVLALRGLLARRAIRPEHVSVVSVTRGAEGPVPKVIRFDEDGVMLDPWPNGFFPEREQLVMQMRARR